MNRERFPLRVKKEKDKGMRNDGVRIGLRLLEFECAITANIDFSHSAEMVDYETSRAAGQATRLAMLIRGQDVIEDEQRLKKIAALELGILPPEYYVAKRLLMEADLIEERVTKTGKKVLNEKVSRINHADNYQRLGELWLHHDTRTPKEEALIYTLDEVVKAPTTLSSIQSLSDLTKNDRGAVIELGSNAGLIDSVDEEQNIYYSPLLWDVSPGKLAAFLKIATKTKFNDLITEIMERPGTDLTNAEDPLIIQAIRAGILPSYNVVSTGGQRVYSFAPYTGYLVSLDAEKTILDKARALVACLRYGSEAATVTRIRYPSLILNALTDISRNYRLKPHSELKLQYGMLVSKQIGRVIRSSIGGRYIFELIPTEDNLRACAIAKELVGLGELMGEKDPSASAVLHLVNGRIDHPLREVKVARRKRTARTDELADLVESLQSV